MLCMIYFVRMSVDLLMFKSVEMNHFCTDLVCTGLLYVYMYQRLMHL